jgi:hypothetical protein
MPTCAGCHDGPVSGAGAGPSATIGCPGPSSGHERALPLKVRPRNMLIQLGEWSRPGFLTPTGTAAGGSVQHPRPHVHGYHGRLAAAGGHHGHGRRLFRYSAARRTTAGCRGRRKRSGVAPSTGQRSASVACHAHSRMRIRRHKRWQGRCPVIGWPGVRVTGGEFPGSSAPCLSGVWPVRCMLRGTTSSRVMTSGPAIRWRRCGSS